MAVGPRGCLIDKATLLPRLVMGARYYPSNVDGFMSQGYLIAKATLLPRLVTIGVSLRLQILES